MAKHSLKREAPNNPLARLYRRNPSLTDALKELRAQFVEDPILKAEVKAEVQALMDGLMGALRPKRTFLESLVLKRYNKKRPADFRPPDVPDYAAARQHFSAWLEDAKKPPGQGVRAQLAREFKGFLPRLISAYEDPRGFFLLGPPRPFYGPDLHDGYVPWFEVATSIREWGLGVLLDPRARQVLDEIDGETFNRFLAVAEQREEFHAGRPTGSRDNPASSHRLVNRRRRQVLTYAAAQVIDASVRDEEKGPYRKTLRKAGLLDAVEEAGRRVRGADLAAAKIVADAEGVGLEGLRKSLKKKK